MNENWNELMEASREYLFHGGTRAGFGPLIKNWKRGARRWRTSSRRWTWGGDWRMRGATEKEQLKITIEQPTGF